MRALALSVALIAALAALAPAALAMGERVQGHADCAMCHRDSPATAANVSRGPAAACDGCHESPTRVDHPVGIAMPRPSGGLPLFDGKVACVSCHNWHMEGPQALRRPTEQLCTSCHD